MHESILAKRIGGVKSNQVLSLHKPNINSNIESPDEVIIHVGSNDISKRIEEQFLVQNIELIGKHLVEMNPSVRVTISSIFLQTHNTAKYLNVVEANSLLKQLCLTKGWDFINYPNISFKHLDDCGMHLTPEGNSLFARNLAFHVSG